MVKALQTESLDAIYGNHLIADMVTGEISVEQGAVLAGASEFEFKVMGKSGHSSRPDLAANPIFASAQILSNISSAWTNQLDASKPVTLGVSQIHGGNKNNIIPDDVSISGMLRFFDEEEGEK